MDDLTGTKYNRLTIIEPSFREKKATKVKVRCDCGNEKIVRLESLKNNATKSCGCLNNELRADRASKLNKKYNVSITHPLYGSWKHMKTTKLFIDPEWKDNFENFYNWSINNGYQKGFDFSTNDKTIGYTKQTGYFHKPIVTQNLEKRKVTCLQKYGVEHATQNQDVINKRTQTNLTRYGSSSPFGNKEVQEKIKQTNINKYGDEYACRAESVKVKTRNTNLKKYGVTHVSQNKDIRNKQINTLVSRYGTTVIRSNNSEQNKLMEWLNSINNSFVKNQYFNNKEIDIYSDKLKLGIEYCGLYWHCEDSKEPRKRSYHQSKLKIAQNNNFRLITIFSDEWINKNKQVKNLLKSVLNMYNQKIFARKCVVREINKQESKTFVNNNHIQGYGNSAIYNIGLYYNNSLVGVITLNKHHRNITDLVLKRMCFQDGIQIVGGASKMFKHCIDWATQNGYTNIISWSDNRWSEGNIYNKLGFIQDKKLGPDYSYVLISNPKRRISKQSCQKKTIGCPSDMTESEFMKTNGYSKIWDCGKIRWLYKIK